VFRISKHYVLFYTIVFLLLLARCSFVSRDKASNPEFVTLKGNNFYINKKLYYPLILNYLTSIQIDKNGELYVRPSKAYSLNKQNHYTTKKSCLNQFRADMQMIKDMGFNAVRLVGFGETVIQDNYIYIYSSLGANADTSLVLNQKNKQKYFLAIEEALNILNGLDLHAIILLKALPESSILTQHLISTLKYFQKNSTILAWDFFNEPLYFDLKERDKKEVFQLVNLWKRLMHTYAPNHLFTIGLTGTREVFEWDPNLLAVDFISIHPYEFQKTEVQNEIYWYGKYCKKPWIVGETGLTADNDSVPYVDQKEFAKKTLQWAYDCGASGFSWWQYKDVSWNHFQSDFLGLLSKNGISQNSKGDTIQGIPKPASLVFKNFNSLKQKSKVILPPSFYNYSKHTQYRITGKMVDRKSKKPIEGGIFLAWNQYYSNSYHTFTKSDGSFELFGDFQFYHWIASAPNYSKVRNDFDWGRKKSVQFKIPTINLGTINIDLIN
jgi:hypothetical protein